jgi:hypothetical protein
MMMAQIALESADSEVGPIWSLDNNVGVSMSADVNTMSSRDINALFGDRAILQALKFPD